MNSRFLAVFFNVCDCLTTCPFSPAAEGGDNVLSWIDFYHLLTPPIIKKIMIITQIIIMIITQIY